MQNSHQYRPQFYEVNVFLRQLLGVRKNRVTPLISNDTANARATSGCKAVSVKFKPLRRELFP